jgi:SAM-dependent methyltransferase
MHLSMGFDDWLGDLERRHLADLRVPEVTRALRALSSAYVERRHTVSRGGPLDSAGKRAAFALFYAPLHFLAASRVLEAIPGALDPPPSSILDVGCGTGAAGAAWAISAGGTPPVKGIDRHPWAVDEARRTYRALGITGAARQADATKLPHLSGGSAVIAAYVLNELSRDARVRVEQHLLAAGSNGVRVLVLEPIARGVAPWWNGMARRAAALGGRSDEWRFAIDLPPLLRTFDKAAGLNHRELTVRSLWLPGQRA